jgi:D-amino peptidase
MNIMVSADMGGATGVTWSADVAPGTEQWHRFRRLLTADVNACAAGLFDGGARSVLVNEAHSSQRNVLLEDLDERCRLLTGRHKSLGMMQGIDNGVDGVVFLGYHAGAGSRGVLAHTYLEASVTGVWLDGRPASEGWLNAALAAESGVPVLLVTGDDMACRDAEVYAPDAIRVAVKEYVSRYAAICLPPARTGKQIRAAAQAAMAKTGRAKGLAVGHRIDVEFDAAHLADAAAVVPTVALVDIRRVAFEATTMTEAMKTLKTVTAIAAAAIDGTYG